MMAMTTFIHTADWQLGKPFARVSDITKRSRLQQERIEVLRRIACAVVENSAAFVLVAGDLFDSTTVTRSTVSEACSAIGQMQVPVYVIPGNHDHGGPGSIWEQTFFLQEKQQLAPNLHVLLAASPLEMEHAVLFPCPLLRRHESADPTAWLRTLDNSVLEGFSNKPRIVLAHGSTQGFGVGDDDEDSDGLSANQIELSRLPEQTFDYVALGDWHGTKQIDERSWYSGTPETDRFPKGKSNVPGNILAVRSERAAVPIVTSVRTGRLRWHELSFHFSEDSAIELFEKEMSSLIATRTGEDLLRLDLGGTLGIRAQAKLEQLIEAFQARLLRVKVSGIVRTAPNREEILALTERSFDPVISSVARELLRRTDGNSDDADLARLALRELHSACHSA